MKTFTTHGDAHFANEMRLKICRLFFKLGNFVIFFLSFPLGQKAFLAWLTIKASNPLEPRKAFNTAKHNLLNIF